MAKKEIKKPEQLNEPDSRVIGCFITPEDDYLLEGYALNYVREYNRVDITSYKYKVTFGINAFDLLSLIEKNKEILFEGF